MDIGYKIYRNQVFEYSFVGLFWIGYGTKYFGVDVNQCTIYSEIIAIYIVYIFVKTNVNTPTKINIRIK